MTWKREIVSKTPDYNVLKILLFAAYKRCRETSPRALCCKYNIKILVVKNASRSGKKGWQGMLLDAGNHFEIIIDSNIAKLPHCADFIITHEFCHYLLRKNDIRLFQKHYWEEECLCDGFSIALLAWHVGMKLISRDNYSEFLQEGRGLSGFRYNQFFCERLTRWSNKASVLGNKKAVNLFTNLAHGLSQH